MIQVVRLPFGEFAPDQRKRDTPALERVVNLVPVFGAYRQVPKIELITSVFVDSPITGTHAHLVTFRAAIQDSKPGALTTVGSIWVEQGNADTPDEVLQDEFDTTYFGWLGDIAAGVPADRLIEVDGADLIDPETDEFHILSFRYKVQDPDHMPTYSIDVRLMEGVTTIATISLDESDPVLEGFQTAQHVLTSVEADSITDYTALSYEIEADKTTTPAILGNEFPEVIVDSFGNWSPSDELSEDPFVDFLKVDTDYLLTEKNLDGGYLKCSVDEIIKPTDFDSRLDGDVEITVKAVVHSDESTADCKVALFVAGEIDPIAELDPAVSVPNDVVGAKTTVSLDVTKLELDGLTDTEWENMRAFVELVPTGGAPTEFHADAQLGTTTWTPTGAATNLDALDTDPFDAAIYASPPAGTVATSLIIEFPPMTEPVTGDVIRYHIDYHSELGLSRIELIAWDHATQSNIKRVSVSVQVTDGMKHASFILDEALWPDVNWDKPQIRLREPSTSGSTQIAVNRCYIEAIGENDGAVARVYTLQIDHRTGSGIKVSNVRFEIPVAGKEVTGDTSLIYAGNKESLFEVPETGFLDVSETSDASYGTETIRPPSSWKFVSWGNDVIASDGSSPPQIQLELSQRFEPLFESDEKPRMRHMAIVKDFLVGANIILDPTTLIPSEAQTDFNEFTVWWTEINNPREIHFIDLSNQSGWQPLYSPAGEIVSLVGGENGTIFKRNSIHRMTYIGSPWIFDFDTVSYNEGTAFGRSPVQVDRDIFFMGNGGFRVIPFRGGVASIGDGKVTKMFIDALNEDRAILPYLGATDATEIEASMFGVYDTLSRLIIWVYRGLKHNAYHNMSAIVYNPVEGAWGFLDDLNTSDGPRGLCDIIAQANVQIDSKSLFRNLVPMMFGENDNRIGRGKMSENEFLPAEIETKILSSMMFDPQNPVPGVVTIHGIRLADERDYAVGKDNPYACEYRVHIIAASDPKFTCDTVELDEISDSEEIDENGWLNFGEPIAGEFFKMTLYIPSSVDESQRELLTYELRVDMGEGEE